MAKKRFMFSTIQVSMQPCANRAANKKPCSISDMFSRVCTLECLGQFYIGVTLYMPYVILHTSACANCHYLNQLAICTF